MQNGWIIYLDSAGIRSRFTSKYKRGWLQRSLGWLSGLRFLFFLEGLVLYFKKTFINFQYQNSYIIGFFSSQLVPKETTPKERTF